MNHSMMTGILAARRMLGEDADPWSVNAEGEYLEEKAASLDRYLVRAALL